MMNPPRTQSSLNNLEPASGAKDHVSVGNAHVFECDVPMPVRGVVVAEDGEHALDGDAGRACGHNHHGLLAVGVFVAGVGFAHDDVDFAAGVAGAGGPPFLWRREGDG